MSAYHTADLDAAWDRAEAALPKGAALLRLTWRVGMHEKFAPDEDYEAQGEWWTGNDRVVEAAYGASPATALRALAARLVKEATVENAYQGRDELEVIKARIADLRPWPEGEAVIQALERYAATLAQKDLDATSAIYQG